MAVVPGFGQDKRGVVNLYQFFWQNRSHGLDKEIVEAEQDGIDDILGHIAVSWQYGVLAILDILQVIT